MAPPLPSSLSPHICVLPSPDLTELLTSSSLPPLPYILQSFSPLPQVTTRTTSLSSVVHASFALRFSDLTEIESACREDEELRAVRTVDWIGARIAKRCGKWVEDLEKLGEKGISRSPPWWDELRRCAEGDHIPSKSEGWNHPVAVILAVSTTAPNPLQAITALHARASEFPSWVDPTILRCTLIIHPHNSPLSDEEAGALFNAVKKQFGLHSYLLPLTLSASSPAVPVPALIPRLPPPPSPESGNSQPPPSPLLPTYVNGLNTLKLAENDIQQTARFTREFVVMSLLPWMEKCVVEWNENFSSTRRLPSRLFSSTRRLFGSPSPSPAPTHQTSFSASSLPPKNINSPGGSSGPALSPPSQQRRLAEFATILGDTKLAVSVWETLRKEGKGGSDILPLLLAPSPTLHLHALNALSGMPLHATEPPPLAQVRALIYAARWEVGIAGSDFTSSTLEGERWLVWAAGNAEEPPSALLLAHAALLSSRKHTERRAALWYLSAANRLEKCGIKPLTMYFLRRAHELYRNRPPKYLSPSFWDSEGKTPLDFNGIDAIMSGIEHPLGRLLYTTGDVAGAVRIFLGLLRGSSQLNSFTTYLSSNCTTVNDPNKIPGTDKVFLDDFRVAFSHLKATSSNDSSLKDLQLPFSFCVTSQTHIRLSGDIDEGKSGVWEKREDDWKSFWRSRGGKEGLARGRHAVVDDVFWIDLVLRNPLDAEVSLSNVTVIVDEADAAGSSELSVEVEVVDDVVLAARELRTVPICLKSKKPASLIVSHVTYDFLSLLPSKESLSTRGRRLHDTPLQRQKPTYAPDRVVKAEVHATNHKLLVSFVDDERLVLSQGERRTVNLWVTNTGTRPINDVWMVAGPEDEFLVNTDDDSDEAYQASPEQIEFLQSNNSLEPTKPSHILASTLNPGDGIELSAFMHVEAVGDYELSLLFVYREGESGPFQSTRLTRSYEVQKLLDLSATAQPSRTTDFSSLVNLEISNATSYKSVHITQITCMSPSWKCVPMSEKGLGALPPLQSSHVVFGADRWNAGSGSQETLNFVSQKLDDVLQGRTVEPSRPPSVDVLYSHFSEEAQSISTETPIMQQLLHLGKRNAVSRVVAQSHPYIPSDSYPYIFPLYNPTSVDFAVFWTIPTQQRSGHIIVPGITLGASHALLKDIINEAETAKVKRSMYAETQREKLEVLDAIRESEWNAEMNPLVLFVQETRALAHNFAQGPCRTPITMTIRNDSLTHRSRFVLRLGLKQSDSPSVPYLIPSSYTGKLTFRGILGPSETCSVQPQLWATSPGTHSLGGWCLETEVLEAHLPSAPSEDDFQVRHRYKQDAPPMDTQPCLVISDVRNS